MTGWMLFDLLATIPFDLIFETQSDLSNVQIAKGLKIFRIIRFLKMLRLVKIFWLTKKINQTEYGRGI